ncbi:GtrA family protein [Pseudomonas yamanorum]|nr:GtrA family protein [Pseudomonas yamanorum]
MTHNQDLIRFIRFCCVGLCNTLIHVCLVLFLVEILLLAPPIANVTAFFIANMTSYFLNSSWTFRKKLSIGMYLKFFTVSLIGLIVSWSCVWTTEFLGFHYLIGVLMSVFFLVIIGYILNRYFVFAD